MTTMANEQVRLLTADDIDAVSGGVIAIIRSEHPLEQASPGADRFQALLPYIEQR